MWKTDHAKLKLVGDSELMIFCELGKNIRLCFNWTSCIWHEKAGESTPAEMKGILDLHLVLEKNGWKKHLRLCRKWLTRNGSGVKGRDTQDWIPFWMIYKLEMFPCCFSHDFAELLSCGIGSFALLWILKIFFRPRLYI